MSRDRICDVSVVVPFNDDEEVIGTAIKYLAHQLQKRGLDFEILAVDEDSGDNSHALLSLIRTTHPELGEALYILQAPGRGRDRGFEHGARHARGRVLWLLDPHTALAPPAPLLLAYEQICRGERDMVMGEHFIVAHRTRSWPALDGIRGSGHRLQRKLVRRARQRRLTVEPRPRAHTQAPFGRLLSALSYALTY